jgi:hypothetical protein
MERYYMESLGRGGWPKCHFVIDRSTSPHTVVSSHGWIRTASLARKLCAQLNEQAGEWTAEHADSLSRLREWAAGTKAFTGAPYDPDEIPTSFVREAA